MDLHILNSKIVNFILKNYVKIGIILHVEITRYNDTISSVDKWSLF